MYKALHSLLLLVLFLFLLAKSSGQTELFFEDFEFELDAGISSIEECSDLAADYWIRTDGTDISTDIVFDNIQGDFFFAVQDHDASGCPASYSGYLNFENIDISGYGNLKLYLYIAEDDVEGEEDWDSNSKLSVRYSIDGATNTEVLRVEAEAGTNTQPRIDTDFDGYGDGPIITSTFTMFEADMPGTGEWLSIEIYITGLNAGDEDVAIDNLLLTGEQTTPLQNVNFDIEENEGQVMLNWQIENLERANYFYVEWKMEGENAFVQIMDFGGEELFAFFSGSLLLHDHPGPGLNYYRIREVDPDGQIVNSMIKSIAIDKRKDEIVIGPKLASEFLNIFNYGDREFIEVEILNLMGQRIAEKHMCLNGKTRLDISFLPNAQYFLCITYPAGKKMERFIKL